VTDPAEELPQVAVLPEFPDHEIHRDGRIFRVRGNRPGEVRSHPGNAHGYLKVRIQHNGIRHTFWVHRLICTAFHGEPPIYDGETAHVRHLDDNPQNNHADNLRWGSRSENERDKKRFYGPLLSRPSEDPEEYDSDYFDA